MTKSHFFIFLIFAGISSISFAQNERLDSLQSVLKEATNDSLKIDALNAISYELFRTEPEKTLTYGQQALDLAVAIGYQRGIAQANKNIGLGYYVLGNYIDLLVYWEASLKAFEVLQDEEGVANLLNNLGAVYSNQGDDAVALDYYLKSLKASEQIGDPTRIATALQNIALVYMNKEATRDQALSYLRRALPIAKSLNDNTAVGTVTSNISDIYLNQSKYDSSIYYADLALEALYGTGFYAVPLSIKGRVFLEQENYEMAVKLQNEAVDKARSFDQKLELSQSLNYLGEAYLVAGNTYAALKSYKEALDVAAQLGSKVELKNGYQGIAETYAKLKEFENAYEYNRLFSQMKDTIFNEETDDKIKGLQFTYQIEKKQDEIDLLEKTNEIEQLNVKRQKAISWGTGIVGILLFIMAGGLLHRYRFIKKIKSIIEKEKDRSENLLLNILPSETAEELKEKGETEAKYYDSVTILFTDFKGFTSISATMSPRELVKEIHECFKMFDIIMTRHGIEKIKTIGDAYMAAGGLPKTNNSHHTDVARAALEIRAYMESLRRKREAENRAFFEIRIGIHTGPVVAGVVGIKKFAYDIWGDTVNIASRMESNSEAGRINISESTYDLIKDNFECEYRGELEAKNRGMLKMYFLNDAKGEEAEYMDRLATENESYSNDLLLDQKDA